MSATDIQSCHTSGPIRELAPQLRTAGAEAMSGTVWLSTTHGSSPHSAIRQRSITSASPTPTTTPTAHPAAAIPRVNRAAATTASHSGSSAARVTGSRRRVTMSQVWGIARSVVRGRTRAPATTTPSSGPRSLYASHSPMSARTPSVPHSQVDAVAVRRVRARPRTVRSMPAALMTRRPPGSRRGLDLLAHGRDDGLAVRAQGPVEAVVLEVAGEVVHAQVAQRGELGDVVGGLTEDAEPVDDLVGHEVHVGVPGPAVLLVVVVPPTGDVVGQRPRHRPVRAVAGDDVGDVVADHAAEPAALVAHVLPVAADVHRCCDTDGQRVRVPPRLLRRPADLGDHPLGDVEVRELEDEPVTDLAGELQRPGAVGGDPHLQ